MNDLKEYAQIIVYIFLAGGAWTMVKFLKESVTELKLNLEKLTSMSHGHETRLAVLESKKGGKR